MEVVSEGVYDLSQMEMKVDQTRDLLKSSPLKALEHALSDPPYGTTDQVVKDLARDAVLEALAAIKDDDIDNVINSFSYENQDLLLKYVYRGFAVGDASTTWLKWHAKIVEKNGIGAIVRVITQNRKVV